MKKEELNLLQTVVLLLDGMKESEIMLKYELAPYLKKAREIIKLVKS